MMWFKDLEIIIIADLGSYEEHVCLYSGKEINQRETTKIRDTFGRFRENKYLIDEDTIK